MNDVEVKQMLATMVSVYTKKLMPEINEFTVNVWQRILADIDFKAAQASLIKWMSTERYPPTPADIRSGIAIAQMGVISSPDDAWKLIQQAVRKYGYMNQDEALKSFPELINRIVGRFGWMHYCMMPMEDVATYYAQFRNAYNDECQKTKERLQIPDDIQKTLARIGTGGLKQIPEKVEVE